VETRVQVNDALAVPLVSQLDLFPLTGALIEEVADSGHPLLRPLDAIHLVSWPCRYGRNSLRSSVTTAG
jgi:hypothetical protein